jgi:ribonuclease P protein component
MLNTKKWPSLKEKTYFALTMKTLAIRCGCFDVFASKNSKKGIGFILPKKQAKLAVLRNLIKRVVHEEIRKNFSALSLTIVVKVRKKILKSTIKAEIDLLRNAMNSLKNFN